MIEPFDVAAAYVGLVMPLPEGHGDFRTPVPVKHILSADRIKAAADILVVVVIAG